jgi:hypothetical protein
MHAREAIGDELVEAAAHGHQIHRAAPGEFGRGSPAKATAKAAE